MSSNKNTEQLKNQYLRIIIEDYFRIRKTIIDNKIFNKYETALKSQYPKELPYDSTILLDFLESKVNFYIRAGDGGLEGFLHYNLDSHRNKKYWDVILELTNEKYKPRIPTSLSNNLDVGNFVYIFGSKIAPKLQNIRKLSFENYYAELPKKLDDIFGSKSNKQ
jgi:hypothetical protein